MMSLELLDLHILSSVDLCLIWLRSQLFRTGVGFVEIVVSKRLLRNLIILDVAVLRLATTRGDVFVVLHKVVELMAEGDIALIISL